MSTLEYMLLMLLLVASSAFFSISEIALAASRKMRLRLMATEGNVNAEKVLALQEHPGNFFTIVQIGLNAVAILGGILTLAIIFVMEYFRWYFRGVGFYALF